MPLISVYFTVSLYVLSKLETLQCYTYQTEPLFLSFSQMAALERNSLDRINKPNSHSRYHEVKTFGVKCNEEGVEVVMKAYLFDPGLPVEAKHLRLGSPVSAARRRCTARVSGNGEYVIRAPLTDCGGKVTVDDWRSERKSSVYFLGETVNIEASVDRRHLPLRLHADSCVATLTSDVNSYPRYPFIDHQGWRSVDGDERVCESCSATSNHKRTPRSKTKHRQTGTSSNICTDDAAALKGLEQAQPETGDCNTMKVELSYFFKNQFLSSMTIGPIDLVYSFICR
ncbi:Zona pellucida sperm-binding protein 3 [Collichthys lucidus]|uniref:Zona pellucida sperm-binding protein 3 n=1 Tax=Collichthys lucidus TaxID=240159 RepID=A0A4U5VVR3_COLLU|nr:Zona pellucida sperm-binding protein 3 [Collichthys lucidus]